MANTTFFQQVDRAELQEELLLGDYRDFGVQIFKNSMANLEVLPKATSFFSLKGKARNVPAVVLGAGPSLDAAMPWLSRCKDQALFIAAGSAARAAQKDCLSPHLYTCCDPDPVYRRFLENDLYAIPFLYQSRLSSAVLNVASGPLIWMASSGHHPLENWMVEECGLEAEPLDVGWTVANTALVIAYHLGCDPIICVGMDFARDTHCIYGGKLAGEEHQEGWISSEGVLTKRDWLMSAEWMEAFVKSHPKRRWIRVSSQDRGLPIQGMESLSHPEGLLHASYDFEGMIHGWMQSAHGPSISPEEVREVQKKVVLSFEKSLALCDELLGEWEKAYPDSPLKKGAYLLKEVELEEEICYRYVLESVWKVWKPTVLSLGGVSPLQRLLFFKQVIEKYLLEGSCQLSVMC